MLALLRQSYYAMFFFYTTLRYIYVYIFSIHHHTPFFRNLIPPHPSLLPQLAQTNLLIIMLVQYLCRRQVEIFLRHMNSSFAQGIHARFGADTFKLGTRAAVHFLSDLSQVDSSR